MQKSFNDKKHSYQNSVTKSTNNTFSKPVKVTSQDSVKNQATDVNPSNNVDNQASNENSATTTTTKEPATVKTTSTTSDPQGKYAAAGTAKYKIVKKITKVKVYKLKKYRYKKWYKYHGKWHYKIYYKYKKVFVGYKYRAKYYKVPINTASSSANSSSITALAKSLKGSSQYQTASKIFNWVRDNINYSFYYNTKYGAAGTLKSRQGNCVDHAHLIVALARSAGLSARYVHATAKFRSGHWYGHVWAQILVNGKWLTADATSSLNSLGVVKNWSSATIHGIYNTLPF